MEFPKYSNLTDNINVTISSNNKTNSNNLNDNNTAKFAFLPKFQDAALNTQPSNYSNPTFNPDYFNRRNNNEMKILENTVKSVYVPQESLENKIPNNSPFLPTFSATNNENFIYDANNNFNLANENYSANDFININSNKNIDFTESIVDLNGNASISNADNQCDFALQNAEKLRKKGYYEYADAENYYSQPNDSNLDDLYARIKSENKNFPHRKDLVRETDFYPAAQDFIFKNDTANLNSDNNMNSANNANSDLINKLNNYNNYNNLTNYNKEIADANADTEKSFNYKIEEIMEKRNQLIKLNLLESQNNQLSSLLQEIELVKQKNFELEDSNFKFKGENEKLTAKIEEYQRLNKEWEFSVSKINNNVIEMEEKNKTLTRQNEELKEELSTLKFKLKLSIERERSQEAHLRNIAEIKSEYEEKLNELKKDQKSREENIRKKYEELEASITKRYKGNESEWAEKAERLSFSLKEKEKNLAKVEQENFELKEKTKNLDYFLLQKEEEFKSAIEEKDKKLKNLEAGVKQILQEANSQIDNLSGIIADYTGKSEDFSQKEKLLQQRILELSRNMQKKNQSAHCVNCNEKILSYPIALETNKITFSENENEIGAEGAKKQMQTEYSCRNTQYLQEIRDRFGEEENEKANLLFQIESEEAKNSLIDKLRNKILILEEENMNYFNALNLKEEEIYGLNSEINDLLDKIKFGEFEFQKIIKEKDFENSELLGKINEMDLHLQKHQNDLVAINNNFERSLLELENEIRLRDGEIQRLRLKHENEKKAIEKKLEQYLLGENNIGFNSNMMQFPPIQHMSLDNHIKSNFNPYSTNSSFHAQSGNPNKSSARNVFHENLLYTPKVVENDDQVKRNIAEQIRSIKEKLQKNCNVDADY